MHPEFRALVNYLRSEPIKLTITSNGYSIEALADPDVTAFHDIEFSLDYPTEPEQRPATRPPGNWRLIHKQAARCRALACRDVHCGHDAVEFRSTCRGRADRQGLRTRQLRINVYQSVRSDTFALTYDEYWRGFEALFDRTDRSPSVSRWCVPWRVARRAAAAGGDGTGDAARDGTTVRLLPGGGAPLDLLLERGAEHHPDIDAFAEARGVPSHCRGCSYVASCGGGCAGRRGFSTPPMRRIPTVPVVRGRRTAS